MLNGHLLYDERYASWLQTVQNKMQVPWFGSAFQLRLDVLLPFVMLPTFVMFAALGSVYTVLSFVALPVVLFLLHVKCLRFLTRTKFYQAWTAASVVILFSIFQLQVVPYMEILPIENFIFICTLSAGLFFGCQTFFKAIVLPPSETENDGISVELDGTRGSGIVCATCKVRRLPRTNHCDTCCGCIQNWDHHCTWLDCCIGGCNHHSFLLAILFLLSACLYGANLSLTTICRPVLVYEIFLWPEDCSEVYYSVSMALPYVAAIYAVIVAILLGILLLHQVFLVSLGMVGAEWRHQCHVHGFMIGRYRRPFSKGIIKNWLSFLSGRSE